MNALERWNRLVAFVNDWPTIGVPGVRDTEHPCDAFEPGEPEGTECETDGHYMCNECVNRASCDCGCGNRPSRCACDDCPMYMTCPILEAR